MISDNDCYRPNTTTAGGSLIKCGGTTSTGIVKRNYVQTLSIAQHDQERRKFAFARRTSNCLFSMDQLAQI